MRRETPGMRSGVTPSVDVPVWTDKAKLSPEGSVLLLSASCSHYTSSTRSPTTRSGGKHSTGSLMPASKPPPVVHCRLSGAVLPAPAEREGQGDGGLSVFALAHPVVDGRASDTDQVASGADVLAVLDVVDEGTCALVVQERAPSGPAPRGSSRHGASLGRRLRECRVLVALGLQDHQRRSPGPHRWPGHLLEAEV